VNRSAPRHLGWIVALDHSPVLRNLRITSSYHDLFDRHEVAGRSTSGCKILNSFRRRDEGLVRRVVVGLSPALMTAPIRPAA
jgi:hypothetical protein